MGITTTSKLRAQTLQKFPNTSRDKKMMTEQISEDRVGITFNSFYDNEIKNLIRQRPSAVYIQEAWIWTMKNEDFDLLKPELEHYQK